MSLVKIALPISIKAREGGRGSKNSTFLFVFVVNSSRDGSCGTKISCQRDCLHPKIEVYIFLCNITVKLNMKV